MGWFSPKKTEMKLAPEYSESIAGRKWLLDLLQKPVPPARGIAGMTPTELTGQDILGDYATSGLPEEYGVAKAELLKTLKGGYADITKSQFFEPIMEKIRRETDERVNQLMRRLQMGGMRASSPGAKQLGGVTKRAAGEMMAILAPYGERERDRQFASIPMLQQFGQYAEGFPVRKMGAIQQYGGLPRQLQQDELNAVFEKILFPYLAQAPMAQFLTQQKPEYYSKESQGGWWDLADLGVKIMASLSGGGQPAPAPQVQARQAGVSPGAAATATGRTPSGGFIFG